MFLVFWTDNRQLIFFFFLAEKCITNLVVNHGAIFKNEVAENLE